MRTFLLLFLLIVMIPGVSLSAQECHCNDVVVNAHECCADMAEVKKDLCSQCSCDMSHSIAMMPILHVDSQALHVNNPHKHPKIFISKSLSIPLFEPPRYFA